jgi:hypothetical protein
MYSLINDDASNLNYMAQLDDVIMNDKLEEDMEGRSRDLI